MVLRQPDPALSGVPAQPDRQFEEFRGGCGRTPGSSPESAFVQRSGRLGIQADGGLPDVARPLLGIGGDLGEPAMNTAPVGRRGG
jgi:hypothetical protein